MKVSELIEWLQKLDQDYEINIFNDSLDEAMDIRFIENYDVTRTYVIFAEQD